MAKSKSGGTRSYLRGRIANDVYSIGKDANGKKQQVVRSLAESVANPQTEAQMRGRMIMSTVMQAVSALSPYIDHSFDNVPNGQPSISEFIRRNYALLKEDAAAHPAGPGSFYYNAFQQKGAQPGAFEVSFGKANFPAGWGYYPDGVLEFQLPFIGADKTAADWRTALAMGADDYFTILGISSKGAGLAARFRLSNELADDTVITQSNVKQLFTIEYENGAVVDVASTGEGALMHLSLQLNDTDGFSALVCAPIFSKAVSGGYEHNTAKFAMANSEYYQSYNTPNEALATYPVGTQRFLNGGEL